MWPATALSMRDSSGPAPPLAHHASQFLVRRCHGCGDPDIAAIHRDLDSLPASPAASHLVRQWSCPQSERGPVRSPATSPVGLVLGEVEFVQVGGGHGLLSNRRLGIPEKSRSCDARGQFSRMAVAAIHASAVASLRPAASLSLLRLAEMFTSSGVGQTTVYC